MKLSRHLTRSLPCSIVYALALVLACNATEPTPSASSPRSDRAASASAVPEVPTPASKSLVPSEAAARLSAVEWFEGSLEQAQAQAKRTDKLLFVDVGAYWCPPCHRLDEEVFVVPEVGRYLAKSFVSVHIDAEKGEGPDLVAEYKVQAYPTMLVLNATGVEQGRIVDFLSAAKLTEALARVVAGQSVLVDLESALASDPDDVAKRFALAHAYALRAEGKRAKALYQQILVADPHNEMGFAAKVYYDEAMFLRYKLDGDLQGAIDDFKVLQQRFPASASAVKAYSRIGRLLHKLGRSDDAIASLDQMLATDPSSLRLAANYGWFSFREQCHPQAGLRVVDQALSAHETEAELHYLRAELKHLVGDDSAALLAIRRASELESESVFYKTQVARFEQLSGA